MTEGKPAGRLAWQDAVRAAALYAAGSHWRDIMCETGVSESQLKSIPALYNATLREAERAEL